jgi:hypothetical protein
VRDTLTLTLTLILTHAPPSRRQDVLKFVTERFRLDLTNEEASRFFQELINSSVSSVSAQIVEKIHSWAQAWRA